MCLVNELGCGNASSAAHLGCGWSRRRLPLVLYVTAAWVGLGAGGVRGKGRACVMESRESADR